MAKLTPRPLLRMVEREENWNALAQVWSAPFEETPGLQC